MRNRFAFSLIRTQHQVNKMQQVTRVIIFSQAKHAVGCVN